MAREGESRSKKLRGPGAWGVIPALAFIFVAGTYLALEPGDGVVTPPEVVFWGAMLAGTLLTVVAVWRLGTLVERVEEARVRLQDVDPSTFSAGGDRGIPHVVILLPTPLQLRIFQQGRVRDDAAEIWVDDIMAAAPMTVRAVIDLAPPLFTALGILFTFIGLVGGLGGLDSTSGSEAMMVGMNTLLAGVSVAFHSSIVGICMSMASLVAGRLVRSEVESVATELAGSISRLKHQSNDELLKKISKAAQQMVVAAEEQGGYLGTLVSDLPAAIATALTPSFEGVQNAVTKIGEASQDAHREALGSMMEGFSSSFHEKLSQQFDDLGVALDRTLEWHRETERGLQELLDRLDGNAVLQRELAIAWREHTERHDETSDRLREAALQVHSGVVDLNRGLGELREAQAGIRSAVNELPTTMERFGESAQRLGMELQEGMSQNVEALDVALEKVNSLSALLNQQLSNTEQSLQETLSVFDGATAEVVNRFNGTLMSLSVRLDELDRVTQLMTSGVADSARTQLTSGVADSARTQKINIAQDGGAE